MGDANVWDAVMAVLTGLNMAGAGFTWWKANQSKTAKAEAEKAAHRAEKKVQALQEQVKALQELADQARGPELVAVRLSTGFWQLTNRTNEPIRILKVLNGAEEGVRRGTLSGVTVPPQGAIEFAMVHHWGGPPTHHVLGLQIDGRDEPVYVPYH